MPQRMMNSDQVARYLHVEPTQIKCWVLQGEIPCEQAGAHPVFRRKDIDAWASQRILGMPERNLASYHRETSQQAHREDDGPFSVCDLLTPDRTVFALRSRTKASVLRDLTAVAEREEILYDPKDLVRSLEEREALCSTGLGGGVAIVHPRHHDPYIASEPFLILARAAHPICFGAPDGKPTDIFFLLVATDEPARQPARRGLGGGDACRHAAGREGDSGHDQVGR
jgi:mannitol/fructose-specific phosphotransferase system IIA component (Ntr-type)